ncbi:MAG: PIG-L family deacetylase [Clostridia bacterium]|nr:PIG-L family deacetylase [Clostridia bacterium]
MKKSVKTVVSLALLLLLVFVPLTQGLAAHAEVIFEIGEEARKVELTVASAPPRKAVKLSAITDNSHYSYFQADTSLRLTFTAAEPVKALYFVFEMPCRWTLILPDGSEMQRGENEFLHEYIGLEQEVTRFEASLPEGSILTEVYAFTAGTLPDWVQVWKPPCEKADLMLMSTHADDEYLWFGGALPYYAGELGYQVQVVYLTNHYNDTERGHELLNGLWTVGVRNYPVITDQFLDDPLTKRSLTAAADYFGYDRVMEFQVEMLRRFAPRVILAQDINGEYGHGAHKLNVKTLLEALQMYQDPSVYPESAEKYGIHPVQKCYLHLWEEHPITVQWSDKILERFGGRSALEMAIEGYRCHRSQQRWSFRVKEYDKYDCRQFGLVYTNVGYDTPGVNDMFEHVDWSDTAEKENGTEEDTESLPPETESASEDGVVLSEKKTGIHLFGKDILYNDAVFAAMACVLSFFAIIAVVCLRRPR